MRTWSARPQVLSAAGAAGRQFGGRQLIGDGAQHAQPKPGQRQAQRAGERGAPQPDGPGGQYGKHGARRDGAPDHRAGDPELTAPPDCLHQEIDGLRNDERAHRNAQNVHESRVFEIQNLIPPLVFPAARFAPGAGGVWPPSAVQDRAVCLFILAKTGGDFNGGAAADPFFVCFLTGA